MDEKGRAVLAQKRAEREAGNYRTGINGQGGQSSQPTADIAEGDKYTLEQAIGGGLEVNVGSRTFEIRPFPMRSLKKMSSEFNKYPTVMLAQSLLSQEDASDVEAVCKALNTLSSVGPEDPGYYSEAETRIILVALSVGVEDDALENILAAIVRTIKFWTPLSLEEEELLKNSIDYVQMVDFARKVFLLNSGLRDRFSPGQS